VKNNVINLFDKDTEFNHSSYCSIFEDDVIGLTSEDGNILISPLGLHEFEVCLGGQCMIFEREKLAEFIHIASILIDSENRWMPSGEFIGVNYYNPELIGE